MTESLSNRKIAILVANGFNESHITEMQRALTRIKAPYKIIAPEQGLVNGWQDNAWGHYFTVDAPIGTALGSDYDALVLVGGERGVAKLKTNLHARRIINHFLEAQKPVSAIGAGVALLALSPKSAGREVAALPELQTDLKAANIEATAESQTIDGNLLTSTGVDITAWIEATLAFFPEAVLPEEEAVEAA